jgi:hypothetical protein
MAPRPQKRSRFIHRGYCPTEMIHQPRRSTLAEAAIVQDSTGGTASSSALGLAPAAAGPGGRSIVRALLLLQPPCLPPLLPLPPPLRLPLLLLLLPLQVLQQPHLLLPQQLQPLAPGQKRAALVALALLGAALRLARLQRRASRGVRPRLSGAGSRCSSSQWAISTESPAAASRQPAAGASAAAPHLLAAAARPPRLHVPGLAGLRLTAGRQQRRSQRRRHGPLLLRAPGARPDGPAHAAQHAAAARGQQRDRAPQ